jgi:hypothetical protein
VNIRDRNKKRSDVYLMLELPFICYRLITLHSEFLVGLGKHERTSGIDFLHLGNMVQGFRTSCL